MVNGDGDGDGEIEISSGEIHPVAGTNPVRERIWLGPAAEPSRLTPNRTKSLLDVLLYNEYTHH